MLTNLSGIDQPKPESSERRLIGERAGLRLVLPHHEHAGIGDVIGSLRSSRLIAGVGLEQLVPWPDDRGCFTEIFRFGAPGVAQEFNPQSVREIQVSFTVSYPGVIKAIHYHFAQTDLWAPLAGMFQVFLCDLRDDSPSWGCINTLFIGTQRPWKVRIPPGVAHGYKVIGEGPAHLVYATDHFYDPADEGRIGFDDPEINYDWIRRPR